MGYWFNGDSVLTTFLCDDESIAFLSPVEPSFIFDAKANLLEVNNRALEVFEYNRGELLGKNYEKLDLIEPKSKMLLFKNLSKRVGGFVVECYDIEVKTRTGPKKWFEVSGKRIEFEGKVAVVVTLHEVTERKKMELSLRDSERLYRSICEDTPFLMLNVDLKGKVIFVNNQIEAYGLSKGAVVGKDILGFVQKDSQAKIVTCHINALAGKIVKQDIELITPRGVVEVNAVLSPLKVNGRIIGCQVSVENVSEKKQLEKRLEEFSLNLEQMVDKRTEVLKKSEAHLREYSSHLEEDLADKTKRLRELERLAAIGELAGMVGHDLRNPLAAIRNATYYLNRKHSQFMGESGVEMLGIIDSSIQHADKIINDLIDYSRDIQLEFKEVNAQTLIEGVLTRINIPSNVVLNKSISFDGIISVDTDRLERVFLNVIKNALDSMPDGGALNINCHLDNQKIVFIFADTGIGIPSEVMAKIFTPLVTTKAQGMGFGLAICKRFVEAHNGKISLASKINIGTVVTISLPFRKHKDN